ncbi:hypothetical protein [uncultured Kordia sp.]|uniref:hypothetical protein n=1 Tax=uncultured Kordia sp. TaxID=507699 RepID=UPI0026170572|nr:hypothetical protein [uncultured Kordia sp.]
MNTLKGTWLKIKKGDEYTQPSFIEFENDQIIHYDVEQKNADELSKQAKKWSEKLSESKYEFISEHRVRFFRKGKMHTVLSETASITEDYEYVTDYVRIAPTKTELTAKEIQKLEFTAQWNNEKISFIFNKELDSPVIKEINKRLNREGEKLLLENLQGTYFATRYENGERQTLIGIKEVTNEKAILFGFPKTPYEIIAQ